MSTKPDETLKGLLETAKAARLSPAEEEQAFTLLKQTLGEGKKGLAISLEALTQLPWSLGVKAVTETWPELKPTAHRQFIAALGKLDSDQGKRMRLSIARGLFQLDQPVAIKLILGFCAQLDPAEGKDRQHFSNVLIGKTKPWILNFPLTGLKPAEINALLKFTLAASQQAPAFTQIWIFGWLAQAGLFEKLSEEQVNTIAATAKRWQPKWQKELKKEVPTLPAPIEEALNTPPPQPQQTRQPQPPAQGSKKSGRSEQGRNQGQKGQNRQTPQDFQETQESQESQPTEESKAIEGQEHAVENHRPEGTEAPDPQAQEQLAAEHPRRHEGPQSKPQQQSRQPQQPQQRGGAEQQRPQQRGPVPGGSGGFDLQKSLGDIHSYVNGLKSEIQQLKNQLRQREPRRPEPREKEHPTSEELETLRRHNLQLEETAAQLRRDIEEMISDHEDRAATLGSSDEVQQFKALLGVKLGKDYFDFEALRRESATQVVRRHLGDLLDHIFTVLKTEGVQFQDQE